MKKFVGLALLGLVAFNSCDSGLNVNEKSETVDASRMYKNVKTGKTNGRDYTFVFTNGAEVTEYSHYVAKENGKYEICVYFTSDFKPWIKKLDAAGITYTSKASSNPFKNQFIWFASEIVLSVK